MTIVHGLRAGDGRIEPVQVHGLGVGFAQDVLAAAAKMEPASIAQQAPETGHIGPGTNREALVAALSKPAFVPAEA